MKIVYQPTIDDITTELVEILYVKKYFNTEEEAQKYVNDLYHDIETNLPLKQKKRAPRYFETKYGKGTYYAIFKKSKITSWYVLFRQYKENEEVIYEVIHLTNNHVDAKYFV